MNDLSDYLSEKKLSEIPTHWHPKEGLFTQDDPRTIASYLISHSEDPTQALRRLLFYMNRAGENLENKTVLNKAKKLIQKEIDKKDD